eukprot:4060180-Amphidinium_carterae.1
MMTSLLVHNLQCVCSQGTNLFRERRPGSAVIRSMRKPACGLILSQQRIWIWWYLRGRNRITGSQPAFALASCLASLVRGSCKTCPKRTAPQTSSPHNTREGSNNQKSTI